jgi:hypothetical protein
VNSKSYTAGANFANRADWGVKAMKPLFLLVSVLLLSVGCAGWSPKEQWDNFAKEMSDDNFLKADFAQVKAPLSDAPAAKPTN